MKSIYRQGLFLALSCCLFPAVASGETIIKLSLGATTPDIELVDGVLSTVDDGDASSTGDQATSATFHGFVSGEDGVVDLDVASFTLDSVSTVGSAIETPGVIGLVTQQTTGGTFALYDDSNNPVLTGTLKDGALHGTTGPASTGGFLTLNLGTFSGPTDAGEKWNALFKLLDANSAELAISLTDVSTNDKPGFAVEERTLANFTADATANIGADAFGTQLPEPTSFSLALFAFIGALGFRRRR